MPLFYDAKLGRVALAQAATGVDVVRLRESGGGADHVSTVPLPLRIPRTTHRGETALRGYLRYVLNRDQFVCSRSPPSKSVGPVLRLVAELRTIGGMVLARAAIRERLAGRSGESLDVGAIESGIRATDLEVVDRPTLGRVL